MNREGLIQQMTKQCRLVRTEFGFSQDQMAKVLGISKKSLVETEKGRRMLSWTETVAIATIFSSSEVLSNAFGGELSDMVRAISFADTRVNYPVTMGGKVWWRIIENHNGYRIQQNIISQHYRLLDPSDGRMISSFDLEEIKTYLKQIHI